MGWSNDELLGTSVIDTTIPAQCIRYAHIILPSLAERRLRTRLVMMYKVSFHLVAVTSHILIVSDTRIRKYHPLTYRQIHTSKDTYRYSFFPYTIPQWNQLPINTLTLVHIPPVVSFRDQLTPAVLCNLL
jgi:hypothetical protein